MNPWPGISQLRGRLSLRARLLSAFVLIMVLSVVSTMIARVEEQAAAAALDRIVKKDMRVAGLALQGIATFLNARRHEKDFLQYDREFGFREARARYATQVQASVAELYTQMRELREVAGDRDTRGQTEQIEAAASEYLAHFLQVVEVYELRGLPHRGLRARLRGTLRELSPARLGHDPRLAATYVELYGVALEMLDATDRVEYELTTEKLEAFERAAMAGLPAAARTALAARAGSFREIIAGMLDASTRLAEHRSAYLNAAQRVEPLLEILHVTRVKASQDAVVAVHEAGKVTDRYVVASEAAAVLCTFMLAITMVLHIGRGVDSLVAYTNEIASGRLDGRAPAVGGKEGAQLASALDTMAGRLRDSRDALKARNAALAARHSEIVVLGEMTNALQTCLNVEEAAAVIGTYAGVFVDDCGAVYLYEPSSNRLAVMAIWGTEQTVQSFVPDDCWALRQGRPYRMVDATVDVRCAHVLPDARAAAGYVCVPVSSQGKVLGLIHLESGPDRADEKEDRMRLLSVLADQLALSLANLSLRESLREQATRDILTGLYNRRFMNEFLERELARAQRNKLPLAVIMFDIDHFKRFNDISGHDAGDAVLQALGRLLKPRIRGTDIVCRYGGEEFLIVMPEVSLEAARERADVMRVAVRELEVSHDGRTLPPVTLSLGLAMLPQHGVTVAELLAAADAAMYVAKKHGRDRLVVYSEGPQPGQPHDLSETAA